MSGPAIAAISASSSTTVSSDPPMDKAAPRRVFFGDCFGEPKAANEAGMEAGGGLRTRADRRGGGLTALAVLGGEDSLRRFAALGVANVGLGVGKPIDGLSSLPLGVAALLDLR